MSDPTPMPPTMLYAVKVRGVAKIPDYIQVRDAHFTLLAYFRADRPEKGIAEIGLAHREADMKAFIAAMPFGKVCPVDLGHGETLLA